MKYKTYKTLTPEQQEEYDYRFLKSPVEIDVKEMLWPIFAFTMMYINIIFVCYFAMTDEHMSQYKQYVQQWIIQAGSIFEAMSWILLAFALIWTISLVSTMFQEYRFLKKCKKDGQRVSTKPAK